MVLSVQRQLFGDLLGYRGVFGHVDMDIVDRDTRDEKKRQLAIAS